MSPRTIVVFGVTGVQGKSVAQALLADGAEKFKVVGVTRNPASAGSKAVEKLGVQLVQGDLDDPTSYQQALDGADGVYINANYFANYNGHNPDEAKAKETSQGKGAVDAAVKGKVKHIVYSALESYLPRQEVPHFDSKAAVAKYIRSINAPATNLYTSYYYSNLLMGPKGEPKLNVPVPDDTIIPSFDQNQVGLWARVAFRDPQTWIGKDMEASGDNISLKDMAETISATIGRRVATSGNSREEYLKLGEGGMDRELWLNYLAFVNNEMKRDPVASKKLVPEAYNFKEWCEQNVGALKERFGA